MNRKDALIIVPRSVTLSIVPSQWACFLAEVTNRGNEQTAKMQQRTEMMRTASLKVFPRRQAKAIAHLPEVMAIRLVVTMAELAGKGWCPQELLTANSKRR